MAMQDNGGYVVEAIIDNKLCPANLPSHSRVPRVTRFRVRYAGYPPEDDEWKLEEELEDSMELLSEYKQKEYVRLLKKEEEIGNILKKLEDAKRALGDMTPVVTPDGGGKRIRTKTYSFLDAAADAALAQQTHQGEVNAEALADAAQDKAEKEGRFNIEAVTGHRYGEDGVEYQCLWATDGNYIKTSYAPYDNMGNALPQVADYFNNLADEQGASATLEWVKSNPQAATLNLQSMQYMLQEQNANQAKFESLKEENAKLRRELDEIELEADLENNDAGFWPSESDRALAVVRLHCSL